MVILLLLRGFLWTGPRTVGSLPVTSAKAGCVPDKARSWCTRRGQRHSWRLIRVIDLGVVASPARKRRVCFIK